MVWAVTARGEDTVTASSTNLVIPSFTPSANSLLIVALDHSNDAGSLSFSGHDDGVSWAQIYKTTLGGSRQHELWACITGSSPSAGTITITKNYGWTYAAACVEITGDFDTAPSAMTDLFGTHAAVEQYTTGSDPTLDVTLSAFASANNMTLALASEEAGITNDYSFTEVQVSAGANANDISVLWYDGADTNPEIEFTPWGTYRLSAIEVKEDTAGGGTSSESIPEGALELVGVAPVAKITGGVQEGIPFGALTLTGFAPGYSIQGVVSTSIPVATFELTGFVPDTSIVGNSTAAPPAGLLELVGFVPTTFQVSSAVISEPIPFGTLEIIGFAPATNTVDVTTDEGIPSGALELVGFAPQTRQIGTQSEGIPNNVIYLSSYAPGYNIPGQVGPRRKTGGKRGRPRPRRIVIIGGQRHVVHSYTEERYLLEQYLKRLQIEESQEEAPEVRKRPVKLVSRNISLTETRIAKLDQRLEWHRKKLRQEDDLLLSLFG